MILLAALMVIASCSKDQKPINIVIPEELPQLNQDSINNLLIGRWVQVPIHGERDGTYRELIFNEKFKLDRRESKYKDGEFLYVSRQYSPHMDYHFRRYNIFPDFIKLVSCRIDYDGADTHYWHPVKYDYINDILYFGALSGNYDEERDIDRFANLTDFIKLERFNPSIPESI